MSDQILDLDSISWSKVYSTSLEALTGIRKGLYTPIPAYTIPTIFTSHTLLIGAVSNKAKPSWRLAFYANMVLRIRGIGTSESNQRFVPLGLTLVQFPVVSSDYQINIKIPRWYQDMEVDIWQYLSGP